MAGVIMGCQQYICSSQLTGHRLLALQEALSTREAQSSDVAAERAALRRDLEKLLRERGTLESLRQVVASAMKSQQVGRGFLCHAKTSGASLFVAVRCTPGVCLCTGGSARRMVSCLLQAGAFAG